ncbi:unnamed protein product, partial [Rotaria magnacalcarata]
YVIEQRITMQRNLRFLLILSILVVVFGSSMIQNSLQASYRKLKAMVDVSNQCTSNNQCASEATGSRACGGPNGYVVYSTVHADSVRKIKQLASRTRALESENNRLNSVTSICSVENPPSVRCVNGKCIKSKEGAGRFF